MVALCLTLNKDRFPLCSVNSTSPLSADCQQALYLTGGTTVAILWFSLSRAMSGVMCLVVKLKCQLS